RATDRTPPFDFDLVDAGGVNGENTFHTFAVADAADGEIFVQTTAAASDHNAGEHLDAFLVAFHNFGMDAHAVAYVELQRVLAKLFRFDFVKQCLAHKN